MLEMNMSFFNFKDIVSMSLNVLYFFGILYPKFDDFTVTIKYVIRVTVFLGFFFGGIVIAEIANLSLSFGDLQQMMKALFLTLTNLVSIGKYYVICKNQKYLLLLIDKINRKEFQPKSKKQAKSLKKYIRLSKIISISLYTGCTMTCGFWSIYPFTEKEGPFLPIAAYIPFKTDDSISFALLYAYEIIATLIGGYTDLSVDSLMASLIMVVCAQLHILNDSIANLSPAEEQECQQKKYAWIDLREKQDIINQKLVECIKHHKAIMDFAENVIELFSTSMFWQFVVSGFVFCATFFEMTLVPVMSVRFFSMALYQYCMLLEIFPICYFGNEVILESNRLTNSAYHSDWVNYPLEVRKNIIFFMTRTQRLLKLYAGGFFTMSLDTFIKILKSSWSVVAVLIQVQKKP